MNAVDLINQKYNKHKATHPSFKAGDTVKVHVKIKEGDKERTQVYEGVVIAIHNNTASSTFTVRKVSYGVAVERIFPYNSPSVEKVEVVSVGKVRRAKLYYMRELFGKKARITALDQNKNAQEAAPAKAPKEEAKAEAPVETKE